ncbi:MAG: hypothetical protein FWB80_07240 [Defluviitaleaceae bacterium]|nr:hypothetical protein [Defluviitaleaceae bacterium]
MKKLGFLALALVAVLFFAACGNNAPAPAATPTPAPVETPAPTPTPEPVATPEPVEEEPEEEERVFTVFPERPADVVWSLTTDLYFQNMDTGARGGSEDILESEYWMGAGSPTFRTVDNPLGGIALQLTDRGANYHAVDVILPALDLDTAANAYQITLIGNLAGTGNITIGGGDDPWTNFFSEDADGDFEMVRILPDDIVSAAGSRGHIRLSSDEFHNITFYEIEIKRVDADAATEEPAEEEAEEPATVAEAPAAPVVAAPANLIYSLALDEAFQGKDVGRVGGGEFVLDNTPHLMNAGGPQMRVIAAPGGHNAVEVFGRGANYHTIDLLWAELDVNFASNTYTIEVNGTATAGVTVYLVGRNAPWDNTLVTGTADANGNWSFTTELSIAAFQAGSEGSPASFAQGVRVQPQNDSLAAYTVHNIIVTRN